MGMGTNAWRYIVAVPGRYSETSPDDCTSTTRMVNFLLVRSSLQQPWRIVEVEDAQG